MIQGLFCRGDLEEREVRHKSKLEEETGLFSHSHRTGLGEGKRNSNQLYSASKLMCYQILPVAEGLDKTYKPDIQIQPIISRISCGPYQVEGAIGKISGQRKIDIAQLKSIKHSDKNHQEPWYQGIHYEF